MNKKIFLTFGILVLLVFTIFIVSAKTCCEKLETPLAGQTEWCQMAESSSECTKEGYTYKDNVETCRTLPNCNVGCINQNTGECNDLAVGRCILEGGIPDPQQRLVQDIPYCQLGCCTMGEYAYMMTNVACNTFAEENNGRSIFREDITDRAACEVLIESTEIGACTISNEFGETYCKITNNVDCTNEGVVNSGLVPDNWGDALTEGLTTRFHADYLCTDKTVVNADCQPSSNTECKDGKVYWKDSCGNFANIYDEEKYGNEDYWSKRYEPYGDGVCTVDSDGSNTCGNCEIAGNSVCKESGETDLRAGDNNDARLVCGSLYCLFKDAAGNEIRYENGQSWCDGGITGAFANVAKGGESMSIYMDQNNGFTYGTRELLETRDKFNTPGSRYFKLRCSSGEIKIDDCQDYRGTICVEHVITDESGNYEKVNQASCIPNTGGLVGCNWLTTRDSCESDGYFCKWIPGYRVDFEMVPEDDRKEAQGSCVPLVAPGFPFWEGIGAGLCAQGIVQENTLFETTIWRDRDEFNFDTWTIGDGSGADPIAHRCYDKCYTIPGYAQEFDAGIVGTEKIYPEDLIGTSGPENAYQRLTAFYDMSTYDLPRPVDNYRLSTRQGQYCHKVDEPDNWETGSVSGKSYNCAAIQLSDERDDRKERDFPVYLTHQEWLESITERARALGDCGYKPNPVDKYNDPFSEIMTVVFQKMEQDGTVDRNITAQKIIYKAGSTENHKLQYDSKGEEIPIEMEVGEPPCADQPEGTVCIVPPGYCETASLGECSIGATTGVCCNSDHAEAPPGGDGE